MGARNLVLIGVAAFASGMLVVGAVFDEPPRGTAPPTAVRPPAAVLGDQWEGWERVGPHVDRAVIPEPPADPGEPVPAGKAMQPGIWATPAEWSEE